MLIGWSFRCRGLQAFSYVSEDCKDDPEFLRAFIEEHFMPPGSDLIPYEPSDFTAEPALLGKDRVEKLSSGTSVSSVLCPILI